MLDVSARWLAMLGHAREEVLGCLDTNFLTAESRQLVPLLYLPHLTAQGEIHEVECNLISFDGQPEGYKASNLFWKVCEFY